MRFGFIGLFRDFFLYNIRINIFLDFILYLIVWKFLV